jgi:dihydroxy-acid dehydratase
MTLSMSFDTKHKSRLLLEGRERAPARSYLRAIGYSDDDLTRPIVGIANTWTESMPCNFHLRRLAEHVKHGVRKHSRQHVCCTKGKRHAERCVALNA